MNSNRAFNFPMVVALLLLINLACNIPSSMYDVFRKDPEDEIELYNLVFDKYFQIFYTKISTVQ
jgi:hypothetical protein